MQKKIKPIWSGAISFGIVQIPVNLYDATQESRLGFNLLRKKDLCPVEYVRVCRKTKEEVPYKEVVRGYEYKKGGFVVLSEKDLEKARLPGGKKVEILQFSDGTIDPKYFEKPYFLEPTKESERQYALLREALKRSGKVAIVRFVLKTREHLGVLKGEEEVILLNQLRFNRELRTTQGLNLPGLNEMTVSELDSAVKLIEFLSKPFRPQDWEDRYIERLSVVIEEKVREKLPSSEETKALLSGLRDSFYSFLTFF